MSPIVRYESLLTMSSKNLYINGCSFTYGHTLPREETWPKLLSDKLGCNLVNESKNGQSFQSITFNSINTLSELNQIGRAHVWTPVTATSRMPSSAWKKKKHNKQQHKTKQKQNKKQQTKQKQPDYQKCKSLLY